MFRYKLVSPPPAYPVSLDKVKMHLEIPQGDHEHDAFLSAQVIPAATTASENFMQRALVQRTLDVALDDFPRSGGGIYLPWPPLLAVSRVRYRNSAGEWTEIDAGDYQVDDFSTPARLIAGPGFSWPSVQYGRVGGVEARIIAGYADDALSPPEDYAANIPKDIVGAILLTCGTFFENREDVVIGTISSELPMTAKMLLTPYKVYPIWSHGS